MKEFNKYAFLKALHGVNITPAQFRILVTMLDYSDANGARAFPGIENLAHDCCMSLSTVQRSLKALCEAGWLTQRSRGGRAGDGRKWASEYALHRPASTCHSRPVEGGSQPVKSVTSTGQIVNVNRSNDAPQPVTRDYPSDPLTSSPKTSNPEASAPLIANSEIETRCHECGTRIVGEPNYNRSTGHAYCCDCPPF